MEYISFENKGQIGILTFNRPNFLNALNSSLMSSLMRKLDEIESSDIRCLILTGAGEKSFVAGADIGEMKDLDQKQAAEFSSIGISVMEKLECLPMPTIAAINGFALGGGLELALACDIRLASENAVFAFPEVGLGIIPGYGGLQRLIRIVGISKAKEIAYKVMSVFEGVGTFCTEMFLTENDEIFVNEVAPRPHNSGHYTIEGCFANQFENHIRAIVGLPFGDTSLRNPTVMVNLIGESNGPTKLLGLEEAYSNPKVHVHLYGKSESKKARKMGHYTVIGETPEDTIKRAENLKTVLRVIGE